MSATLPRFPVARRTNFRSAPSAPASRWRVPDGRLSMMRWRSLVARDRGRRPGDGELGAAKQPRSDRDGPQTRGDERRQMSRIAAHVAAEADVAAERRAGLDDAADQAQRRDAWKERLSEKGRGEVGVAAGKRLLERSCPAAGL
jgi:hypothetical protein